MLDPSSPLLTNIWVAATLVLSPRRLQRTAMCISSVYLWGTSLEAVAVSMCTRGGWCQGAAPHLPRSLARLSGMGLSVKGELEHLGGARRIPSSSSGVNGLFVSFAHFSTGL